LSLSRESRATPTTHSRRLLRAHSRRSRLRAHAAHHYTPGALAEVNTGRVVWSSRPAGRGGPGEGPDNSIRGGGSRKRDPRAAGLNVVPLKARRQIKLRAA
jgi:hypothetical protein